MSVLLALQTEDTNPAQWMPQAPTPSFSVVGALAAVAMVASGAVGPVYPPAPVVVPELSWQSVFPEIVRSAQRPVNEGGMARWNTDTPAPTLFPLSWSPRFADFALGPSPSPQPEAWVGPERQPVPTHLGWRPTFPDFAYTRTPPVNTGGMAGVFALNRWGIDGGQIPWRANYPDAVPGHRPRQQPAAWTGSVRQPEPRSDSWHPQFADAAPGPRPRQQPAAWVGPNRQPEPRLDSWLPHFDDFTRSALPRQQPSSWVGPNRQPEPRLDSWLPHFDDFARALVPREQPAAFVGPDRQPEPRTDSWLPHFDDFARVVLPRQQPTAWVGPSRQPVPTHLGWLATYADSAPGPLPRTQPAAYAGPDRQPVPPIDSWLPSYPDKVYGKARVAWFEAFSTATRQPDPPSLSWLGTFVDRVYPVRLAQQPAVWTGPVFPPAAPAPTPDLSWLAVTATPQWPQHVVAAYSPATAYVRFPGVVVVLVSSWLPSYPDAIRTLPRQQPFGVVAVPFVRVPLDWQPEFPDFARKAPPRQQPQAWTGPVRQPVPTHIGWLPHFEDFARAPLPRQQPAAWTGPNQQPVPRVTQWLPHFEDFARAPRPRQQPAAWTGPLVRIALISEWQAEFPDFARTHLPRKQPDAWTGPVRQPDPPPLAWQPVYPDILLPAARNPFGGLFEPRRPHVETSIEWLPTYPDQFLLPEYAIALRTHFTLVIVPPPPPPFVPTPVSIRSLKPGDVLVAQIKPPFSAVPQSGKDGVQWLEIVRPRNARNLFRSGFYGYVTANDPVHRVLTMRVPDTRTLNIPGAPFMNTFMVDVSYDMLLSAQLFLPQTRMPPEVVITTLLRWTQLGREPNRNNIVHIPSVPVLLV